MSDTIKSMDLVYADLLTADQIMENDLIEVDGIIVDVLSVHDDATGDNYTVTYRNDYGEEDEIVFAYDDQVKLFVFIERDE